MATDDKASKPSLQTQVTYKAKNFSTPTVDKVSTNTQGEDAIAHDGEENTLDTKEMTSETVSTIQENSTVQEDAKESGYDENSSPSESGANDDSATNSENENFSDSFFLKSTTSNNNTPLPSLTDPNAIRIKFIFANRDGLNVHIDCKLSDTVGEVKGALLSVWPKDIPECSESDRIRLICMGKGFLMPDSRSLVDCQVPVFKTHATPINVSIKPESTITTSHSEKNNKKDTLNNNASSDGGRTVSSNNTAQQGCACIIL